MMFEREREPISSRDEPSNWLSNTKRPALNYIHASNTKRIQQAVLTCLWFVCVSIYKTIINKKKETINLRGRRHEKRLKKRRQWKRGVRVDIKVRGNHDYILINFN